MTPVEEYVMELTQSDCARANVAPSQPQYFRRATSAMQPRFLISEPLIGVYPNLFQRATEPSRTQMKSREPDAA